MMYFAGIDPDLHSIHTAIISCEEESSPRWAELFGIWTVKAKGAVNEEAVVQILRNPFTPAVVEAVAIESQQVSYTGRTNAAKPQDLIHLAQVAGGLVSMMWRTSPNVYLPVPQAWKGSVPKHIKQARVFSTLGIKYSLAGGRTQYAVPENFKQYDKTGNLNAGDWIDAGDSVGLALYAAERYFKEKKLTKPPRP